MQPQIIQDHNIIKGSVFAIAAFFAMAVFGVLTQQACKTGDPIWVSFITYAIGAIGAGIFILPRGIDGVKSQHYGYLIARGVIGTTASFLYMISMRYIPIINSTLLFNTAPIFIPLLSVLWLKLKVPANIWFAVLLGFIGIIVIIRPNIDTMTDPGNVIGLLSGIALAFAYLFMKKLTITDTGLRIILYYLVIGTLMQVPLLTLTEIPLMVDTVIYACLCGIMLLLAQIGLVKAYMHATAAEVGVYQYSSVVFVGIIAWLVWSTTPDLWDILGFILVSIAGIVIIRSGLHA